MSFFTKFNFIFMFCALVLSANSYAEVVLDKVVIYKDVSAELTISDILKKDLSEFKPVSPEFYGYTKAMLWLKIDLPEDYAQNNILYSLQVSQLVEIYDPKGELIAKSGVAVPLQQRSIKSGHYGIKLTPGLKTIYIKTQSIYFNYPYFRLQNTAEYNEEHKIHTVLTMFILGAASSVFIFSFLYFLSSRNTTYAYYLLFMTSNFIYMLYGFDNLREYRDYFAGHSRYFFIILMALATFSAVAFVLKFLNRLDLRDRYNQFLFGLGMVYPASNLLILFVENKVLAILPGISMLTLIGAMLTTLFKSYRRERKIEQIYLLVGMSGITIVLISLNVNFLFNMWNPQYDNKLYGLAMLMEFYMISRALTHRINEIRLTMLNKLEETAERLENYNRELEDKVQERTEELQEARDFLDAVVNSLDQGLIVFDKTGKCNDFYTKSCENLFSKLPKGIKFDELLGLQGEKEVSYQKWMDCMFNQQHSFTMVAPLGPAFTTEGANYRDKNFKKVSLKYFPMMDENEQLVNVVATATDITQEEISREQFLEQESLVKMIVSAVENKSYFFSFYREYRNMLALLLEKAQETEFNKKDLLLLLHTLKGNSQMYNMNILSRNIHRIEGKVHQVKEGIVDDMFRSEFIQDCSKIEELFNQAIQKLKDTIGIELDDDHRSIEVKEHELQHLHSLLKSKSPLALSYFEKNMLGFPIKDILKSNIEDCYRVATNKCKELNKIEVVGGKLRIDDKIYGDFFSNLTHLFRNCIDHGIEYPKDRTEAGKLAKGTIGISAQLDEVGDKLNLKLSISDDGAGINVPKIKEILKKNDPDLDVNELSDHEAMMYIFEPSFSTSETLTLTTGRGVGMTALKESVDKLGGRIEIFSELGKGSRFTFTLPLVQTLEENLPQAL